MKNRLLSLFALAALCASATLAQTQAVNGSIRGRVTDQAGSPVPAAAVDAQSPDTGAARSFSTGEDGYFVFPNLPLGSWNVTIRKEGFETMKTTGINLSVGTQAEINAQMVVGQVSTSIEVTGGAPVIEPTKLETGRTITHDEVDNVPLTSRNPYNLIFFQPGVSGHPNPELGIPRTINTNGLLDRINYQLDGMVNTQTDRFGLRLFPISEIYVREVQTVSNSYAPEFGRTSGNIYNVISNSGNNQPRGEFYYIGRPIALNARPTLLALSANKPDLTLTDFAVNSSGPIKKDKLFIFGGYEHLSRGLPAANTINPANAALIGLNPALLAVAPAVQHAQFLNIRADWMITQKHQAFLRYNYFRNEFPFNSAVGGLNALDVAADFRDRAHVLGAQLLSTFTPNLLNEWRASYPYRNNTHFAGPGTGTGAQVVINGIATFGGSSSIGDRFAEKIPSLNDNVTWIHGSHTVKTGFGFAAINDNQIGNAFSRYTFPDINSYLAAKNGTNPRSYASYATVLGVPGAAYKSLWLDSFVQDSWKVRPNVTVNYGMRYDHFRGPGARPDAPFIYSRSFRTPGANFAPRLGVAWSPNSKTVVRANGGIFYEAPATNLWFNSFNNDGSTRSFQTSLTPATPGSPAFPTILSVIAGAAPVTPSITTVTPNFKNAYTMNFNAQIERQLGSNESVMVGFIHTGARNQGYLRNLNLINPTSFLGDGRPVYSGAINASTRLYPQFNNITLQDIGANADYEALVATWQHRFSQGYSVNASYTWSHTIADAPDANSFEQNLAISDPTSRRRDRSNSTVNRPQALTFSTVLNPTLRGGNAALRRLVNDNKFSILGRASSGDVINFVSNRNLTGDTLGVNRPLYLARNAGRGLPIYQFDGRFTRTIFKIKERIEPKFFMEVNNIFNKKNITTYNGTVTVDALGLASTYNGQALNGLAPTSKQLIPTGGVLESRIVQMGLRVDW